MQICWGCLPENNSGPFWITKVSHSGPCKSPAAQRHFSEHIVLHHGQLPALARVWKFTLTLFLRIDWMHVGPLGCCSRVAGSCLISLCTEHRFGHFTGTWPIRTNNALRYAYRQFNKWARDGHLVHSHQCFTAAQLSCSDSCHQFPDLKAKAHNCAIVLRWIAHVCENDVHSEEAMLRSALAWALSSLHITFSEQKHNILQNNKQQLYHEPVKLHFHRGRVWAPGLLHPGVLSGL